MFTSDSKIAKIFNDYFSNLVLDLGFLIHQSQKSEDPIAISKYLIHPGILKHFKNRFSFKAATLDDEVNEL